MSNPTAACYWDASAILSLWTQDRHTAQARRRFSARGPHLVSSLAFAEVCAVLARLEREGHLTAQARRSTIRSLGAQPWAALHVRPDRTRMVGLAERYALRGADLWHVATAMTLAAELPGLRLVTFDARLSAAARGEGLLEEA